MHSLFGSCEINMKKTLKFAFTKDILNEKMPLKSWQKLNIEK